MNSQHDLESAVEAGVTSARDVSDRLRETRCRDIAFWLLLLAAPLIAHPVFQLLGMVELNLALAALIIGSALLTLLAFWYSIRRSIIKLLPNILQDKPPPITGLEAHSVS